MRQRGNKRERGIEKYGQRVRKRDRERESKRERNRERERERENSVKVLQGRRNDRRRWMDKNKK